MATYAVGDIQGCFSALEKLLKKIQFDSHQDQLWCVGDLVNRGPQSLETLRFIKALGTQQRIVLGNHDLHLLAVAYGVREVRSADTLQSILEAKDRDDLLEWLCHCPFLVHDAEMNYVMTHAGLAPMWTLAQAKAINEELSILLQGDSRQIFLREIFGNLPDDWTQELVGPARWRCAINYLTRMRLCHPDGRLNLTYKGRVEDKPEELLPWFEVPNRVNADIKIIFGHWAALGGKTQVRNIYPLDTGCVWGNCLTAFRLEDAQLFNVGC